MLKCKILFHNLIKENFIQDYCNGVGREEIELNLEYKKGRMGIDRKEAGKGVSRWRMTKRRHQASRIGGFLIKGQEVDVKGEG